MHLRLALVLSCMGLLTACGDDQPDGLGSGGSASTALHFTSLSELKLYSNVAVEGVVRAATDDPTADGVAVDMEVRQTLWSRSAPLSGSVRFMHARSDAPAVGEEAIVFLSLYDQSYVASGGATSRFHVVDGAVTPVTSDGVSVPAGTDLAAFVSLLEAPEPEPEPIPAAPIDYYGGGGGSY